MKKIQKQILILTGIALLFIVFDVSIYEIFTRRVISSYSQKLQAKSVELDEYLPFDSESKIVRKKAELSLTGDLPVMDGAAALYPVFSAFVGAVYPEESCLFDGENFLPESRLQMNNTRGAYQAVVDGDSDIVFCADPSKEQLAYAKEKGVELKMVPIGSDAFVFVVNAKNPINSLTVEQVRGIYTGKYTNWAELGGADKRIGALQRNEGSGSQTAMLSFMGGEPMKKDYDTFLGSAIGYSFRFYVEGIVEDSAVKLLSLNGVAPSKENIQNKSYPVVGDFYAIYRSDNTNPNIPILIDWMLSEEGQQIVEETGYVRVAR
ncbi:MAG: substrate-binding domain-containing protein [Lachnospiraceae bacterium]|nr:substrate-binding domain-containing protein [Lachnospiraceae bacterium]